MLISDNLNTLHQKIRAAEIKYQRTPNSVKLLAVSKQQSLDAIQQAITAGQHCFGENYLQEALSKIIALNNPSIEWHFIGKVQSNKTQAIAQHFAWVHSIDRLKIAERLNAQRPKDLPGLNVCIEVNISEENTKSGVPLDQLSTLAHQVAQLENLRLRGLMVIPAPLENFEDQLNVYQQVADAQKKLCAEGLALDTLSMGMSDDFEAAIAAGSTMVRIGTGVFGKR